MDNKPNYETYHLHELEAALQEIDQSKNPKEAKLIKGLIKKGGYNYLAEEHIEGLGGWLILVGFGILIAPFKVAVFMYSVFPSMFFDGTWLVLTTPGTLSYHPLWMPYLICEIGINTMLIFVWAFIVYLFFSKKKAFPKWYIGTLLFTVVFILLDSLAIKLILPNEPAFDAKTLEVFVGSLVTALIWVPYMLVSKRVKVTFVKD